MVFDECCIISITVNCQEITESPIIFNLLQCCKKIISEDQCYLNQYQKYNTILKIPNSWCVATPPVEENKIRPVSFATTGNARFTLNPGKYSTFFNSKKSISSDCDLNVSQSSRPDFTRTKFISILNSVEYHKKYTFRFVVVHWFRCTNNNH